MQANATSLAADNAKRNCLKRARYMTKMWTSGQLRHWSLMSLAIVATLLCDLKTAATTETAIEKPLKRTEERRSVSLRGLMPIPNCSDTDDYFEYQDKNYHEDFDVNGKSLDRNASHIAIIVVSVAVGLILMTVCLTWKACVECCTSANRRSRHRAFMERSNAGWRCEICDHTNESSHTECMLCGTTAEEIKMLSNQRENEDTSVAIASPAEETNTQSDSNYLIVFSPGVEWNDGDFKVFLSGGLNIRQLVARERHQWKRSIGVQHVRWVNIPFEALLENEALRSTIIKERDFQEWQKRYLPQASRSSRISLSSALLSYRGRQQLSCLAPGTAFVREDSHSGGQAVRWCLAEDLSMPSRQYSKTLVHVAALTFSKKVQWFYRYSLKLSSSIANGFHTIRIHRDRVLKQSVTLLLSVPSATLHRSFRVHFMEEVGVDGGGILREWLHLICSQLFAEPLGLFSLTSSTVHQGYWINRTATKKSNEQLRMYVFFGKLLAKALLEGLLLSVRLSIPLLKHILGAPLKLSDLYLLDETVHSSMMWILENDNTSTLGLNFTVEGVDLVPSGANVSLHDGNKQLYVVKVAQYYLFDSVRAEISSIMEGVQSVISDTMLHIFDFKELDLLLSGLPQIDVTDWKMHTDVRFCEHDDSEFDLISWFWEILESFTQNQRGRLLQYVTGSSGVPVEGFKGLTGMDGEIKLFTIQLGKDISTVYTVLPHASTCLNRRVLDLPLYSSKAELERILLMIIEVDVTGFSSH
ncbi:unnamed protein product [Peronospora farinosa]|uniref:HECT-type E3 ubiquitin transferase n=1 Tax=Peronospora farinosa TaxID=134698 RepID=A0AAV0U5H0_9STRA|nr:unnamed protein product [Peronospora farinosa]CAI5730194.1 unnamed protein product [Peronospora farinosa]